MKRKIFVACLILPTIVFSVSPHGYSLASLFVSLRSGGAALTHADFMIIYTCSRVSAVLWKSVVPLILICWTAFICMNHLGWKRYLALPLTGLTGIFLIDLLLYALGDTPLDINPLVILSFVKLSGIVFGGLAVVLMFDKRYRNQHA